MMGRMEERTLDAWQKVVHAVRGEGAAYIQQLWHPGAMRKVAAGHPLADYPALSPSGLIQGGRPHGAALSAAHLDELEAAYVKAACHAQQLGANGVEVHAAHGYLMDQFLWAESNRRDDEFGGSTLAQRARYPARIVRAIRRAVGTQFVISFRFSQFKEVDYGASVAADPHDLAAFLTLLRAAGVDMFNVSSRRFVKREWPQSAHPERTIAEWVKALTDVPVMTCGSVGLDVDMFADLFDGANPTESTVERDLRAAAQRVARGTLDLVGVGRAHIANNDFVSKVRRGAFAELALFNKNVHLAEAMAAIEAEGPGFVEEARKTAAAE